MENLNAENIINEIQSLIKALKDCGGWVKRGNGEGWFNHDILEDALALINSQEQKIKELTEERDTFREYAYNMQRYVENIKHKEEVGYEPSAARYVAEMEMWRVVALEKQKLTEENERMQLEYGGFIGGAKQMVNYLKDEIERLTKLLDAKCDNCIAREKADTIMKMQERFAVHFGTYTENDTVKIKDLFSLIDQIANELINTEKCDKSTSKSIEKCEIVKKIIDTIKSKGVRNAYSCMISGDIRETYTISGKALEEIEKELLEGAE